MDRAAVFKEVARLEPRDFYKTMPSETFAGLFQDVYHAFVKNLRHQRGVLVYCKVQISDGALTVISFKLKDG